MATYDMFALLLEYTLINSIFDRVSTVSHSHPIT